MNIKAVPALHTLARHLYNFRVKIGMREYRYLVECSQPEANVLAERLSEHPAVLEVHRQPITPITADELAEAVNKLARA